MKETLVFRLVISIPGSFLFWIHASILTIAQGAEVLRVKVVSVKLGVVTPMEMVLEGHLIFLEQGRPSRVVVTEALWLRN